MKTIETLQADAQNLFPEDKIEQQKWMKEQIMSALSTFAPNMNQEKYQQAMFNWQLQLHEFIIRLFTEDETVQAEALGLFRAFAQDSHLFSTYNALVASTTKKLVVPK